MFIDKVRVSVTQFEVDNSAVEKEQGRDCGNQMQQPHSSESAPRLDWLEAADALLLLNSMVRRTRVGPGARPLVRW